ncbi:type IV toxin-antitoxin system AbiEi family antitoxin domain-containing protein [Leucothrix mucor]|uniref:type IV toxin-antitoxin system AbiEi family antitoxin domain-containing protein n=1 Tax=Leucothrix mucor TaxID=45248 RepID=UPI0003B5F191|nr:hypothetical protein [Leucothrix mucor]
MSDKKTLAVELQQTILTEHSEALISRYEFVKYRAALKRQEQDTAILRSAHINTLIKTFINTGIITPVQDLPVYKLVGHPAPSAQQVICKLNPFCYLSHLSAMEWHHLTDRIPHSLHVVTCSAAQFKQLASELAAADFPNDQRIPFVPVKPYTIQEKILDRQIEVHQRKLFKNPLPLDDSGGVRVASIGQTFLDMLKEPEFCGGFAHVLNVFEDHAAHYLSIIVKATERDGKPIDKVRMGYVLEEHLGLSHPKIETWKTLAQRGGSRVLVAGQPFSETYSETWSLSINLPDGI